MRRGKRLSVIEEEHSAPRSSVSSTPSSTSVPLSGRPKAPVTPPPIILLILATETLLPANPSLTITFLYPAYASYKALQTRPRRTAGTSGAATAAAGALSGLSGSDAEVERWLMYWAVVGVWAGVEGAVGWLLTW